MTPALREALAAGDVPEDVAAFMDMVAAPNDERNRRLRTMRLDVAARLNTAGVTRLPEWHGDLGHLPPGRRLLARRFRHTAAGDIAELARRPGGVDLDVLMSFRRRG